MVVVRGRLYLNSLPVTSSQWRLLHALEVSLLQIRDSRHGKVEVIRSGSLWGSVRRVGLGGRCHRGI